MVDFESDILRSILYAAVRTTVGICVRVLFFSQGDGAPDVEVGCFEIFGVSLGKKCLVATHLFVNKKEKRKSATIPTRSNPCENRRFTVWLKQH